MDGGVSANSQISENRGSRRLPLQPCQGKPSHLYRKILSAKTEEESLEFLNGMGDEILFDSYIFDINRVLSFASTKGWARLARRVLEFPKVNIHDAPAGKSPLIRAAFYGHDEVASVLIQSGADVNRSHEEKRSPLHWAAYNGHSRVVQVLLETEGLQLNPQDQKGMTPLHLACRWNNPEVVKQLLETEGLQLNPRDQNGMTPLHHVCDWDHLEVVRLLLQTEGVQLNPLDQDGKTPLHFACRWNNPKIVRQLLEAGADPNIRNNRGRTPFTVGLKRRNIHLEEIKLFLQQGSYIEAFHYQKISQDPVLKENILKDVDLCAQSVINRYHLQLLPALEGVPHLEGKLPCIDNFKLSAKHVSEVKNYVWQDIQANTFCNVVGLRPFVLMMMCVETLLSS